ncbi:ADP-ribosyl cyclase/cyclic ADP-ribose hydrolase 1-like [Grus japonensis]|uniref:ADP-ribosyl cyclase/cyclic ADP-ribose hydrolase 1-like n=1 Tax=Grus japonensis TaxID=30415 RepID=A0ABC9WRW0_GRUJA
MPFQQGSARTRQRTVLLVGIAVLLAALVLAVLLASVLTHGTQEVSPKMMKWKDRGTTKNLKEVILGRCYNYIMARYPELGKEHEDPGGHAEREPPMCPCSKGQWYLGLQEEHWQQSKGGDPSPLLSTGETHLECWVQFWAPQYEGVTDMLGACLAKGHKDD